MKKSSLTRFIDKYSLAGMIESVKLDVSDNKLATEFISGDKNVLGKIKMEEFECDDMTFGVYDTSKLTKMLSVLSDIVGFSVKSKGETPVVLEFNDESTTMNYVLADLSVIPEVPSLKKLPKFEASISLDNTFINKYIKAKSALPDEPVFTFICDDEGARIIIGHSNMNTNRISIDVECECSGNIGPISFNSSYFKEILVANKEVEDSVLKISSQGLAHITFSTEGYESEYYLVEVKV